MLRIPSALVSLIAALSLCGCVYVFHQYGKLVGPLPALNGGYLIQIQQVEGPMKFNGHALGFARTLVWSSVRLPSRPVGVVTYQSSQIIVESEDELRTIPATSGTLRVDMGRKTVEIDLQTASGPSLVNGKYSLHL